MAIYSADSDLGQSFVEVADSCLGTRILEKT